MTFLDSDHDAGCGPSPAPPVRKGPASIVRWGWFGSGLTLGGVAAAGWGYALRWSQVATPGAGASIGLFLAAGALALLVVDLVLLARRRAHPERRLYPIFDTLANIRARAYLAAVIVGLLAVYGLVRMRRGFAGGLPETGDLFFGIGMSLATVGLVMLAKAAADLPVRSLASLGAGLLVVAAALPAGCLAAATLPVESITATPATPAATPATVSKVAWRWRMPDGGPVQYLTNAGGHVIVGVSGGVVALDPATGRERWRYRRPGAEVEAVLTAPNLGTVSVVFGPVENAQEARSRTVLLDPRTGVVLGEMDRAPSWRSTLTPYGFVSTSEHDVAGWVLPDLDEPAWLYRLPSNCRTDDVDITDPGRRHIGLRDVIASPVVCRGGKADGRDRLVVTALSPRDGSVVWRYEHELPADGSRVTAFPSPDRSAMRLILERKSDVIGDVVLAQASGQAFAEVEERDMWFANFTADGYLSKSGRGERRQYRWESYDGGVPKRATAPAGEAYGAAYLPLRDSMLEARATSESGRATIRLEVAAWGTNQSRSMPFAIDRPEITDVPPSPTLMPAAGAVVLAARGGDTIIGLT
ncbi:PQQ-binding-like beta-propeller repeat protein [Nonomuraea sp. NPDC046802]|uniref:outer membrane protein assembly factor BamB family protein n=1 Tax=Nonomuraea sp. NPDC046802 TaxID=3154919 RepID=UPI0033EB88FC